MQIIYPTKNLNLEYMKNPQNPTEKYNQKMDKRHERHFT